MVAGCYLEKTTMGQCVYIVRGKDDGGALVWTADEGGVYTEAFRGRAKEYTTIGDAFRAWEDMRSWGRHTDVRIFAVADDGTETALPSHEDAIGQRNAFRDHLAIADKRADALVAERDALLALLNRVDYDGKSLPGELRDDIGKALDAARKAGWARP